MSRVEVAQDSALAAERRNAREEVRSILFANSLGVGFAAGIEEVLRPSCHAFLSSGVVRSQSGRHFLVTARRF